MGRAHSELAKISNTPVWQNPRVVPSSTVDPRVFVGLWPGEDTRRALVLHQLEWSWPPGVRLMEPESLHVTLHFIGAFPGDRLLRLHSALAEVRVPRFSLELGEPEVWPGGIAVVYVQPSAALSELHHLVGVKLQGLGIALDSRPYAPHVTLARRAVGATTPAGGPTVVDDVGAMVLAESVRAPTPHYKHVHTYRLRTT